MFANMSARSRKALAPSPDLRNSPQAAAAIKWLEDECGMDRPGAEQAAQYIVEGRAVLRAVPTQTTVVAERFFDESGGMQLVIHAPFGGRINKAWGLALRKRFCRSFNFELQAAATDNGLNISLSDQHSFPARRRLSFPAGRQRRAAARASRADFADFRHALALGCRALARAAALHGREKSSAADSTHAFRRFAGRRVPASAGLPGKYFGRHRNSRPSPRARNHERRAHRSHGRRRPENSSWKISPPAAFAAWPWKLRCLRNFRTRS